MNTRKIAITTGVIASVIGLGFLSYFLFSKKEAAIEESKERIDPADLIRLPEKRIETVSADRQEVVISEKKEVVQKENTKQLELVESNVDATIVVNEKSAIIEEDIPLVKNEIIGDEFPLQLGSTGKRIERLQVWLLRNYGYSGKITAEFDQKTLGLVQKHLKVITINEQLYNRLEMEKRVYEQSSIS